MVKPASAQTVALTTQRPQHYDVISFRFCIGPPPFLIPPITASGLFFLSGCSPGAGRRKRVEASDRRHPVMVGEVIEGPIAREVRDGICCLLL